MTMRKTEQRIHHRREPYGHGSLDRFVQRLCCKTNHHNLVIKNYDGVVGMSYATCLQCGVLQYWHDDKEKWLDVPKPLNDQAHLRVGGKEA